VRYSESAASYSFANPVFRAHALSTFSEQDKKYHFPFALPKIKWTTVSDDTVFHFTSHSFQKGNTIIYLSGGERIEPNL
jgi:hypothetical protein